MNDSGNVTKDGQQNVDEEVSTTAALEEDTKRREDDGDDDLDDVAERESVRVVACVPRANSADRSPRKRRGRHEEETHDPVKAMLTVFEVVVGLVVERCGWWRGCM